MKKVLVVIVVLVVAVGALSYWRGWFSVATDGKVDVHADPAKFRQDKVAFGKAVSEKGKALKDKVASLWKNAEGLTGDDKVHAEKELTDLEQKHERLEKQLQELEDAGPDRFESIKQDLSKRLGEVEQKIEELTKKLEKGKDK